MTDCFSGVQPISLAIVFHRWSSHVLTVDHNHHSMAKGTLTWYPYNYGSVGSRNALH